MDTFGVSLDRFHKSPDVRRFPETSRDYLEDYLRNYLWNLGEVSWNLEICGNGKDIVKVSLAVYKPSVESWHG